MPQYEEGDTRLIPQELQRQSGPIPDEMRDKIKVIVLEKLGETQNKQFACGQAGITRATYNNWVKVGYITQAELEETREVYADFLRGEIQVRFMQGVAKPLIQNGRLVRDAADQPMYINTPDSKLLLEVAKRWLPEFQGTDKIDSNMATLSSVPSQFQILLDARELTNEEFQVMKQIVQNIEDRRSGVVIVNASIE